jgi:hypothetical protein
VWKALAQAADDDPEVKAFTFTLLSMQGTSGSAFLGALRGLFKQYDGRFWCELVERLVAHNLLTRADGTMFQDKLLRLIGRTGQWK